MGFEKLNLMRSVPTDRKVAGADCSGARETPNETWLALATLSGNKLEVSSIQKTGMHALARELTSISDLFAAGLDCPFSLPAEFITFLCEQLELPEFQSWQSLAEQLVFMPFEKFQELARTFKKEAKRVTDKLSCAQALSPLHRVNPAMLQMTYYGIRMLASLDPGRFYVLPFQQTLERGTAVLEVYPRATLKCLLLPDTGYKSSVKKEHARMQSARHKILQGLLALQSEEKCKDCPRIVLNTRIEQLCVESDHALDALLACYTTALWLDKPSRCGDPYASNEDDVLLEGWIYEPDNLNGKRNAG